MPSPAKKSRLTGTAKAYAYILEKLTEEIKDYLDAACDKNEGLISALTLARIAVDRFFQEYEVK